MNANCQSDTGACIYRPKCEHACNVRGSWKAPLATPGKGSDMRRIVRVSRLLSELGHTDVIDALNELKALRSARPSPDFPQT